jgi:hypothetical protein
LYHIQRLPKGLGVIAVSPPQGRIHVHLGTETVKQRFDGKMPSLDYFAAAIGTAAFGGFVARPRIAPYYHLAPNLCLSGFA